ncbi:hypothetical protein [Hyphomicrobium nitrativorans]|nr:hypothetical protein [Hyphomicrobium nitrativorans]
MAEMNQFSYAMGIPVDWAALDRPTAHINTISPDLRDRGAGVSG